MDGLNSILTFFMVVFSTRPMVVINNGLEFLVVRKKFLFVKLGHGP